MAIPTPPKINPIPVPEPPSGPRQWALKAEILLLRFMLNVWNAINEPVQRAKEATIDYFMEKFAAGARPYLAPYLSKLDTYTFLPPEIKETLRELRGTDPLTVTAITIMAVVGVVMAAVSGLVSPFARRIAQEVDHVAQSGVMPLPQAWAARKRGSLAEAKYHDTLKDAGWSDELITAFEAILQQRVPTEALGHLKLREFIDESEFRSELTKRGYPTEEITHILHLMDVIPPLPDIIRMAVREAFTPDVVARFQLHAELPTDMVSWAAKQGLTEDWAKAYWASHWELPSLSMGFEMLHRGEISEEDMQLLIKTHDVSPFWRDKLTAIAYTPYTRVDVRRMYDSGVLTKEDVHRSYMDIGYDNEKATKMTEFTVALSNAAERDLTKSEVLNGFKIGYFTQDETIAQLLALGYDQAEAEYYISKVLYDLWQAEIKEVVKYVSQQYITGQITESDVYAQLGALNLPATQINRYIHEWDLSKQAKTKTLPAVTLVKFYQAGVITEDEFANEMSGIGYSNKYIEWYLNSMSQE